MNVIIFYEHLVREWNSTQRLKKKLEEKGYRVKAYSLVFQRTIANLDALFHKPDVIFLPWFRLEEHEKTLSTFLKINPNVRLINLHQEQITSKNGVGALIPQTDFTKNGSYHFTWGTYFKNALEENGVDSRTIRVTGSIRNDTSRNADVSKQYLASEYGLDEKKDWILFAENRGWLLARNTPAKRKEYKDKGVSDEQYDRIIATAQESIDFMTSEMNSFSSDFAEKYEFIYRPHPGTVYNARVPSCVHVISDRSIYDWLHNCAFFITCESTSIFEADMCGVPCVIMPDIHIPAEGNRMAGVWEYPQIQHLSEINQELIDNIKSKSSKKVYEEFLGVIDGKAVDRTVAAMESLFQEDPLPLIPYAKISCKAFLRQCAFEITTWICSKTNILNKRHFPKSAYVEKGDIPFSKDNSWIRGN